MSRIAAVELAEVLQVAPTTAKYRLDAAVRSVEHHPSLLARVGTVRRSGDERSLNESPR